MRLRVNDGFGCDYIQYDEESVFDGATALAGAPGVPVVSTDPVFVDAIRGVQLVLYWTPGAGQSADFNINMRVLDLPRGTVLQTLNIRPNVSAVTDAGISVPILEIAQQPQIYGWCDIQVVNNDAANDLAVFSGKIYQSE
jgi:hypothetical protein